MGFGGVESGVPQPLSCLPAREQKQAEHTEQKANLVLCSCF